jgi:hypothetical protein
MINKRFFWVSSFYLFGLKWSPPAVVCSFCVIFFIVFLTHMHNRLVSMTCTRYRSNADDSTLSNCCCRSMALLNFSTYIRLINQMLLLFIFLFLSYSPQGSAYPLLLAICSSDYTYEQYTCVIKQSTNQSYLIVLFSIGMYDVCEIKKKNQLFCFKKLLRNHIDNYYIAWRK